jgi:hypothetical protein
MTMSTDSNRESDDPFVADIEERYADWESEFGDDVEVRRTTNFEGKQ